MTTHIEAIARAMAERSMRKQHGSYIEREGREKDVPDAVNHIWPQFIDDAEFAFNMSAEICAETTQAEAVKSNTGTEYHAINRAVVAIRALVKEG